MKKHVYILSLTIALIGTHMHAMESNQEEAKKGERLYSVPRSLIKNKEDSEKIKVTEEEAKKILRRKREQCNKEKDYGRPKCWYELTKLRTILCGMTFSVDLSTTEGYEVYGPGPCEGELE